MANLRGLQPSVRENLKRVTDELDKEGIPYSISPRGAFRTYADQEYLHSHPGSHPGTPAAPAGSSDHERGIAIDLQMRGASTDQVARGRQIMEQYGFSRPLPNSDPAHFVSEGLGRAAGARGGSVFNLTPTQQKAVDVANSYGIPPAQFLAVIDRESNWNANAKSTTRTGRVDLGLGQLSPSVAAHYGVTDRLDPTQNLMGTARYLVDLQTRYGDWTSAVAHYIGYPNADAYQRSRDYGKQTGYEQQWSQRLGPAAKSLTPDESADGSAPPVYGVSTVTSNSLDKYLYRDTASDNTADNTTASQPKDTASALDKYLYPAATDPGPHGIGSVTPTTPTTADSPPTESASALDKYLYPSPQAALP